MFVPVVSYLLSYSPSKSPTHHAYIPRIRQLRILGRIPNAQEFDVNPSRTLYLVPPAVLYIPPSPFHHISFSSLRFFNTLPHMLDRIDWRPLRSAAKVVKQMVIEIHPLEQFLEKGAWDPDSCMPYLHHVEEDVQELLGGPSLTLSWCRGDHGRSHFY